MKYKSVVTAEDIATEIAKGNSGQVKVDGIAQDTGGTATKITIDGETFRVSASGTVLTFEQDSVTNKVIDGDMTVTVDGSVSAVSGSINTKTSTPSAGDDGTGGDTAVETTYTYDLTGITKLEAGNYSVSIGGKTINVTLADGATSVNDLAAAIATKMNEIANQISDGTGSYKVTSSNAEIIFTSSTKTETTANAVDGDITVTGTVGGASPVTGDWNTQITNTATGPAAQGERLASTVITLDANKMTAGSVITIGGTDYTCGSEEGKVTLVEKAGYTDGDPEYDHEIARSLGYSSLGQDKVEGTVVGKALKLQIGDTSDVYNQLDVKVGDMHVKAMGIDAVQIDSQEGAAAAIQTIRDAINYVSGVRGDLGAVQNRLEHTGNNLSVMAENIQDVESTIRDTDVANEMMAYVKNNILVQSAQAMLAQANQVPQSVLQLLG